VGFAPGNFSPHPPLRFRRGGEERMFRNFVESRLSPPYQPGYCPASLRPHLLMKRFALELITDEHALSAKK